MLNTKKEKVLRGWMKTNMLVLLILAIIMSNVSADNWASSVVTNSSSWYISRQSNNIEFNLSSTVEGSIAPIEFHGKLMKPYTSYYAEVMANDVRLSERTSGLEGKYRSEDKIRLWANTENEINIVFAKPNETNIYVFRYNEQWPVSLAAARNVKYSGQQINERNFEGNNHDFVSSTLLYNRELDKEQNVLMWLNRMNATVRATDDAVLQADFMPTKYLGYFIRANTTGIADLKYKHTASQYNVKRGVYPAIVEGDETYYGPYEIKRKIEMRSVVYDSYNATENSTENSMEEWLPCCYGNLPDGSLQGQKFRSVDEIFNCSCLSIDILQLNGMIRR